MQKDSESEENPDTIRKSRILFDDGDESAPEDYQLDVIEQIPLGEGHLRLSAGVLDEARNQESGENPNTTRENRILFDDSDESESEDYQFDVIKEEGNLRLSAGVLDEAHNQESEENADTIHENRILFKSPAAPEDYQIDLIEEIPLEEVYLRLSAGVLDEARNQVDNKGQRHHGKPVILENCIGINDSDDSDAEEVEEEREHQLEDITLKEMAEEIRGMNATLDRMQARLSIDGYEEIAKLTSNLEEEMGLGPEDTRWMILNGSKDPEIRALQVNSRRIRCQVADLVRCSELGSTRLTALTRQTIRHSKHLMAYRKQYESVHSFHLSHQLEAGKCLMRYRHSQQVYSNWRELHQMGRKAKEAYNKILEITQTRGPFLEIKKQALADIAEAHSVCISSSSNLATRVEELGQALGIPSTRTSKVEPEQWKDYHGPPVVVKTTHWQGQYTYTVRFARGELFTIPVVVPPVAATWYGRMQAKLLRDQLPKTIQDSCDKKNVINK